MNTLNHNCPNSAGCIFQKGIIYPDYPQSGRLANNCPRDSLKGLAGAGLSRTTWNPAACSSARSSSALQTGTPQRPALLYPK